MLAFIQWAREAGMVWEQVGEALGLAEVARARGSSFGEAGWEYWADRSSYRTAQLGKFARTCPECGETVRARGPGGGTWPGTSPDMARAASA